MKGLKKITSFNSTEKFEADERHEQKKKKMGQIQLGRALSMSCSG